MQKTNRIKVISSMFILMTMFVTGCSGIKDTLGMGDTESVDTIKSNTAFIVNANDPQIKSTSYSKSQSVIKKGEDIAKQFNLADVKGSIQVLFSLSNGLSTKITSINIVSSVDYLQFTQQTIGNLDIKGSGDTSIIQCAIIHGKVLNGIGNTDILSMGNHTPTFSVVGSTIEGNKTTSVTSTYQLVFNAKVASFELIIGEVTKNISDGDVSTGGGIYGGTSAAEYFYTNNKDVKIKNNGNIDLSLRLLGHADGINYNKVFSTYTILQGQTVIINTPLTPFNQWVEIDGNNAVFDFDVYDIGNNGKAYFELLDGIK